ncbi:MAG: DUF1810 domain-containing protein [Paramuribaculum sp.]|nr:DUF1810 domain-containing protein [Paramuribaculum sp.]MDE6460645.1 DUF1810 domain-containing protein [Paramuribaculum sp.]
MDTDTYNLARFVRTQETAYPIAVEELRMGIKRTHWMWFIFPQLKHLGFSANSKHFGISGKEEALAYLDNKVLGERLREVSEILLNLPADNAVSIFGELDSMKLRSSMTLFDSVAPDDVFAKVLSKFFNGERDSRTIQILSV